jgi:hypothetical protein
MPKYRIETPNGVFEVESATPLSDEQAYRAALAQSGGGQEYKGAPDAPLEDAYNPVEDIATLGLGGLAGGLAAKGLSQVARRLSFSPAVGKGVVRAVEDVAPAALQPAKRTIGALSDVMRQGGKEALSASRQQALDPIIADLTAKTAAARAAASSGMTGEYAQSAASAVTDKAAKFKSLLEELADTNRGAFSPTSGQARGSVEGLRAMRAKPEILDEIKGLLSPDQFEAFTKTIQPEYAKGSALLRLFKSREGGRDVLSNRIALQKRAGAQQGSLPQELLDAIFNGAPAVGTDSMFRPRIMGTNVIPPIYWKLSGPSGIENLMTILGGAGGAYAGVGGLAGLRRLLGSMGASQPDNPAP